MLRPVNARERLCAAALTLGLASCGASPAEPPAAHRPPNAEASRSAPAKDKALKDAATAAPTVTGDEAKARGKDLDTLCHALHDDYGDGTLSDYYAKVTPATAWGRKIRERGNAADQPGRDLESAVADYRRETGSKAPAHCSALLDDLDDLE